MSNLKRHPVPGLKQRSNNVTESYDLQLIIFYSAVPRNPPFGGDAMISRESNTCLKECWSLAALHSRHSSRHSRRSSRSCCRSSSSKLMDSLPEESIGKSLLHLPFQGTSAAAKLERTRSVPRTHLSHPPSSLFTLPLFRFPSISRSLPALFPLLVHEPLHPPPPSPSFLASAVHHIFMYYSFECNVYPLSRGAKYFCELGPAKINSNSKFLFK